MKRLQKSSEGTNIDYNYAVELLNKSRAKIFSWVELKSFHNDKSAAAVFSWVHHSSHFISVFFSKSEILSHFFSASVHKKAEPDQD